MKKLIPALCMLLVAACLMGTSTYAWFAANEDVTATGMSVKAAADGGLAIASYTPGDANVAQFPSLTSFAASAAADWTNQTAAEPTVLPTSTMNGVWWKGAAASADKSAVNDKGYEKIEVTAPEDLAAYAQMTSFIVKSLDQSGKTYGLKVSGISLQTGKGFENNKETDPSKALNNAIRVAIAVTDVTSTEDKTIADATTTKWFYFAPFSEGTISTADKTDLKYVAVDADDEDKGVSTKYTSSDKMTIGAINSNGVYILDNGLDTDGVRIDVYVYYEGEDADCTSANIALSVDQLKLQINYSSAAEINLPTT